MKKINKRKIYNLINDIVKDEIEHKKNKRQKIGFKINNKDKNINKNFED